MSGRPKAIENLLTGLIDYAGLFPPASLDMRTAVGNYLKYRRGAHASVLGRFVVTLDRIGELREAAGDMLPEMRLSVIVPPEADLGRLPDLIGEIDPRAAFEFKARRASDAEHICAQLPAHCERYFELPFGIESEELLDALAANGGRVKLRLGGVVAEAFPDARAVAVMLDALARRRISFKATAGLHHPVRSRHSYTGDPNGPSGTMHGFLNLAFAAILLHFGGTGGAALKILETQDAGAWRLEQDAIACCGFLFTAGQLAEVRKEYFISFGSCSFEEPICDLGVMGWL